MALEPTKHLNGRMWPPGVSGQPEWQTCRFEVCVFCRLHTRLG